MSFMKQLQVIDAFKSMIKGFAEKLCNNWSEIFINDINVIKDDKTVLILFKRNISNSLGYIELECINGKLKLNDAFIWDCSRNKKISNQTIKELDYSCGDIEDASVVNEIVEQLISNYKSKLTNLCRHGKVVASDGDGNFMVISVKNKDKKHHIVIDLEYIILSSISRFIRKALESMKNRDFMINVDSNNILVLKYNGQNIEMEMNIDNTNKLSGTGKVIFIQGDEYQFIYPFTFEIVKSDISDKYQINLLTHDEELKINTKRTDDILSDIHTNLRELLNNINIF